jgi:hypothetical protein
MPSSKARAARQSTQDPRIEVRAQRLIAKLQMHYNRGKELDEVPGSISAFEGEHGFSLSTLSKDREFARKYSQGEFDQLTCLRRRSSGLPLHWGHVQLLLTCPWEDDDDKEERAGLQANAAAEDWSPGRLYQEIKTVFPDSRRPPKAERGIGGRKRTAEPGSSDFLQSLLARAKALQAGLEELDQLQKNKASATRQSKLTLSKLEDIRRTLTKSAVIVKRLRRRKPGLRRRR